MWLWEKTCKFAWHSCFGKRPLSSLFDSIRKYFFSLFLNAAPNHLLHQSIYYYTHFNTITYDVFGAAENKRHEKMTQREKKNDWNEKYVSFANKTKQSYLYRLHVMLAYASYKVNSDCHCDGGKSLTGGKSSRNVMGKKWKKQSNTLKNMTLVYTN